ncbi:unnamed protein product [Phytomonas sp. EM1]|nr:unnamed protein product [Phytomonas sp. EM1]|eukprot:CCW60587.1 unnamed protein product [Phytomonas sp. isolate EM1]
MLRERTHIKTLLDATGHAQEGIPRDEGNPSEEPMMDSVFAKGETAYAPPRLLPFGRVMERERLLTTKQVTIDATGEYLKNHLPSYPLTSSNCVKEFMAWTNNPMWKTRLREEE